jgi:fatty acid kinase fatty acid binding subunit
MTVRIVTDSTCDLPAETISRYGIWVIPLYIHVGRESYLDGVDITREEFYSRLPSFHTHPTTAVPSPEKFQAVYNTLADDGASEVISIHVSSSLSAVYNVAQIAAQDKVSVKVIVYDSRQLSLGTGFLVEKAARLAELGLTANEIIPQLDEQIKRTYVFAALDTMEYLRRSGRVNRIVASLGSLLQIKPIMKMYDGVTSAERVRTSSHAMDRMVRLLSDIGEIERLAIVHSGVQKRMAEFRQKTSNLLPLDDVFTVNITPVIGSHTGPGVLGYAAVAASKKSVHDPVWR